MELEHIIDVYDATKSSVLPCPIEIVNEVNKYSAIKTPFRKLKVGDILLNKHSKYFVKYKCCNCNNDSVVGITQFIRKLNKDIVECNVCKNSNVDKRFNHSHVMKSGIQKCQKPKLKSMNINDLINKAQVDFDKLSYDEQCQYYDFHLTSNDYERIKPKILSFGNGKYNNISNYTYIPVYPSFNQMKFTSVLYDNNNNMVFKAYQPIFKCDTCEMTWRAKSIEGQKNNLKVICNTCKLCRKIFKIRKTWNVHGESITYQSKLELKFIQWAKDNAIVVNNGPLIQYIHNNKHRTYRVDFMIKDIGILIEIKDNHIWHQQQIENGIWKAKISAVNTLIDQGKYTQFMLITPKNWHLLNSLLKPNKI